MKNYLSLFLLFITVYDGLAQRVGNPDDTAKIVRPCLRNDLRCIRKFFAKNSNCKIVTGPVPDPFFKGKNVVFIPVANLTATHYNFTIEGLNGKVEEFYVNYDTDRLVIAIEFNDLVYSENKTFIRFHRRGKEPVVTSGSTKFSFKSVVVTAVIPRINHLQLERAVVTAFVNDFIPKLEIGPTMYKSSDPVVATSLAAAYLNLQTVTQEFFLTEASFAAVTYIQFDICDFGLINL